MRQVAILLAVLSLGGVSFAQDLFGGQAQNNLLLNPGFELGSSHWYPLSGVLREEELLVKQGARSIRSANRTQAWMGPAQNILPLVQSGNDYVASVWVRIDGAVQDKVILTLKQVDGTTTWTHLASANVAAGEWVKLMGAFNLAQGAQPTELTLYIEGPQAGVDLLVDYSSLTPAGDWRADANARIEQHRKRDWQIKLIDVNGGNVVGAQIEIRQKRHHFAFGSAVSDKLISDPTYRQFFLDNFEWAVFENQTKWPHNEPQQGNLNYTYADAMYNICEQNGIPVRGHCVFWAVDQYVQSWVQQLDNQSLQAAMLSRISSVVGRYKNKFEHWDVNNEMLHGNWYESRLGPEARSQMFKQVHKVDRSAKLFVNDYNVVAGGQTADYLMQIQDLLAQGAPISGIGAQGHFWGKPIPEAIYSRLDQLSSVGLPVWITEFDVTDSDPTERADMLERFYRTAFSHPDVEGILMWGFWAGAHWRGAEAAIVDLDWTINEAGRKYQSLIQEWSTNSSGLSSSNGRFDIRAFHGDFEVLVTPLGASTAQVFELSLRPGNGAKRSVLTVF